MDQRCFSSFSCAKFVTSFNVSLQIYLETSILIIPSIYTLLVALSYLANKKKEILFKCKLLIISEHLLSINPSCAIFWVDLYLKSFLPAIQIGLAVPYVIFSSTVRTCAYAVPSFLCACLSVCILQRYLISLWLFPMQISEM